MLLGDIDFRKVWLETCLPWRPAPLGGTTNRHGGEGCWKIICSKLGGCQSLVLWSLSYDMSWYDIEGLQHQTSNRIGMRRHFGSCVFFWKLGPRLQDDSLEAQKSLEERLQWWVPVFHWNYPSGLRCCQACCFWILEISHSYGRAPSFNGCFHRYKLNHLDMGNFP